MVILEGLASLSVSAKRGSIVVLPCFNMKTVSYLRPFGAQPLLVLISGFACNNVVNMAC